MKVNTPEEHPDYLYICDAHTKAEELAQQVNNGVRERDNSDKLEWVQNHASCEGLAEVSIATIYHLLMCYSTKLCENIGVVFSMFTVISIDDCLYEKY